LGDAYNSTQRDINVMPITRIVFNDAYQKDLRRKIKIVVDRLLIEERNKILIENKAIEVVAVLFIMKFQIFINNYKVLLLK